MDAEADDSVTAAIARGIGNFRHRAGPRRTRPRAVLGKLVEFVYTYPWPWTCSP